MNRSTYAESNPYPQLFCIFPGIFSIPAPPPDQITIGSQ
jgi:hypothetical protein